METKRQTPIPKHPLTIANNRPIIGDYNVNAQVSGDLYNKGSNMWYTLRQGINDDEKWRAMLRGLNKEFYHRTVTTQEVDAYMAKSIELE